MQREMRRGFGVLLLCLLCACGAAREGLPADPSITPNVVYGHRSGVDLTLDVYRAEHPTGAAVVFLMSGGWRSLPEWKQWVTAPGGVRLATDDELRDRLPLVLSFGFRPLLESGVTVFSVYHGNSPRFRMPEIVADVRRALRFIRGHSVEYDIDPERIGLWGLSAGGHLALLLAMTGEQPPGGAFEEPPTSARVAAVVAYSAPTDLRRAVRGPRPRNPALVLSDDEYEAFSPFRHVSAEAPPTLIVHGEDDELVDVLEGRTMHEALRALGVETRLVTIPGAGHGFVGEAARQASNEAVQWFTRHLGVR